jgi:predicted kinase
MQKIIFLQGLPASGKTTWAKQYCIDNPEFIRINKDDIREIFGNPKWNSDFEYEVIRIQHELGFSILQLGKSIIVDDTNFAPKHLDYWKNFAAYKSVEFEIKTFDTPVEECIKRDKEREKSVGKEVIYSMNKKYLESK